MRRTHSPWGRFALGLIGCRSEWVGGKAGAGSFVLWTARICRVSTGRNPWQKGPDCAPLLGTLRRYLVPRHQPSFPPGSPLLAALAPCTLCFPRPDLNRLICLMEIRSLGGELSSSAARMNESYPWRPTGACVSGLRSWGLASRCAHEM